MSRPYLPVPASLPASCAASHFALSSLVPSAGLPSRVVRREEEWKEAPLKAL